MEDIRERMIGDMKLRGLTPCTQATYLEAVKVLARHYNSRLDEITKEQVRDFLLYLLDSKGYAKSTYKVYLSAIKFLYLNTLDRQWRFRREERKKIPSDKHKPAGRKPGHPGSYRKEPDHIDETIELPLNRCPHCSGPLIDTERMEQIIEDIPAVRPHVVKVITYHGLCPQCGPVETTHPLQTSHGQGAAKVQLGPRALALSACLNKVHGLTMRKTCRVLQDFCGLRITPGGLSQALLRIASRVKGLYDGLIDMIRDSPAVFADETSWWVGGPGYWLWVFTTAEQTIYRVDHSRGSKVVNDILGDDFRGILVSDCLSSYDPAEYAKHKCIAHHLRAISKAMEPADTADLAYLLKWRCFFRGVIALYHLREVISREDFIAKRQAMECRCYHS